MTAPARALVIGGSLGGLFAAHYLRRAGWEVDVFERVGDDLAARGAGIGTQEELFEAMRGLDLPIDERFGVPVRRRVHLDRAGRVTFEYAIDQIQSAWATVYRRLKDALPARCYHFGCDFLRYEEDADGVRAHFAGGRSERGALLVGADGVRSAVRAQLFPAAQPRYAGYVAWRGVLDEWAFPPRLHAALFETYVFCLPEGEMMLCYPVPGRDTDTRPGRRGYNFIWYRPTDPQRALPRMCTDASGHCHGNAIPPQLIRREILDEVRADARAKLAPDVAEVVERTEQLLFQAIFDLESPRMGAGRVALLGDAAFVARPHVGLGVTKAALDARCLARSLRESGGAAGGGVGRALARYDLSQRWFGSRVIARARRLGAYLEGQLKPPAQRLEHELRQEPERVMPEIGARLALWPELDPRWTPPSYIPPLPPDLPLAQPT